MSTDDSREQSRIMASHTDSELRALVRGLFGTNPTTNADDSLTPPADPGTDWLRTIARRLFSAPEIDTDTSE